VNREAVRVWAKKRFLADKELKNVLWEKKGIIVFVIAAAVLLLFFGSYVRALATIGVLITLGFASLLYNRAIRISLGIELVLMGTVLAGLAYGPLAAFFTGGIALFAAEVFNGSFQHSTLVSFIGLAVVSAAIPVVSASSVSTVGVLMALLYNAVLAPGYLLMGSEPWKVGLFFVTDILFNAWLFILVVPRIAGLV
jgi:hypothetical protein